MSEQPQTMREILDRQLERDRLSPYPIRPSPSSEE
jgi:hypothetical protein